MNINQAASESAQFLSSQSTKGDYGSKVNLGVLVIYNFCQLQMLQVKLNQIWFGI